MSIPAGSSRIKTAHALPFLEVMTPIATPIATPNPTPTAMLCVATPNPHPIAMPIAIQNPSFRFLIASLPSVAAA